jgi:ribonuclease HI
MTNEGFTVYTDGGCRGNPGPGGWAYVMRYGDRYREAYGAEMTTTNNRMELTAVIKALSFLKKRREEARSLILSPVWPSSTNQLVTNELSIKKEGKLPAWINAPIHVYTDSLYVKNGISIWLTTWKARGWKTAAKKPVMNQELWQALDYLCQELNPQFEWVEGHTGNADNERCDTLVQLAIKEILGI